MTERDIQRLLFSHFDNHDYRLFNIYAFRQGETDFFCISKSGYVIEVEIKISKADFKKDFEKTDKHLRLSDKSKTYKPNRFFYAAPEGIISLQEVPEYAGLIIIEPQELSISNRYFYHLKVVKNAPFLHKKKHLENPNFLINLLNKYYYRYMEVMAKYDVRHYEAKFQKQIKFDYKY